MDAAFVLVVAKRPGVQLAHRVETTPDTTGRYDGPAQQTRTDTTRIDDTTRVDGQAYDTTPGDGSTSSTQRRSFLPHREEQTHTETTVTRDR